MISRRSFLHGAAASLAAARLQKLLANKAAALQLPGRAWLGAAYYPELTPHSDWQSDFKKMAEIGINVVRMAEFAWSCMQPAARRFDFEWLDEAIGLAHDRGIAVFLGVPTASVPPWLHRLHPDVLGGNEHGPYTYGGRKGLAVHSAPMKSAARTIIRAMAARYANNPAVAGWQLSNEPGYPFTSYDLSDLKAFRAWLKAHYKTLDTLNAAWGGRFWSNTYDTWDEIEFPSNPAEMGFKSAVHLDYRRFFSESWLEWLSMEAESLRSCGVRQMIYANWPEATWSVDVFKAAPLLDAVAWDNYGPIADDRDYRAQFYSSLNHDFCRSCARDRHFFVAEQRSQAPATSSPGAVRLQTLADFAYGAFGAIYFEWKPPVSGAERGYVSILERDGSFGASRNQIIKARSELDAIWPRLRNARTIAPIAMLFSFDNQWDRGFGTIGPDAPIDSYKANFQRFYTGAKVLGTNIDIVSSTSSFEGYTMILAPGLQMISEEACARLQAFVANGGCLVLDQGAGTRDCIGRDRDLRGPGVFESMCGLSVDATSRVDGSVLDYLIRVQGSSVSYPALADMESVTLRGARQFATLSRPQESSLPAVMLNSHGKGLAVYFAASSLQPAFYEEVLRNIAQQTGIKPLLPVPLGVDVVSRCTEGSEYIFLMNLTPHSQTVTLATEYRDALTGVILSDPLQLDGFDVRILVRASMHLSL